MNFNSYQRNTIKLCAKEVARYNEKNSRLDAQIEALRKEQAENNQKIEELSAPIVEMTGGYGPLDLVHRVVNEKNVANWVFIYPETIVPPTPGTNPAENLSQAAHEHAEGQPAIENQRQAPAEQEQNDAQAEAEAEQAAEEAAAAAQAGQEQEQNAGEGTHDPMDEF